MAREVGSHRRLPAFRIWCFFFFYKNGVEIICGWAVGTAFFDVGSKKRLSDVSESNIRMRTETYRMPGKLTIKDGGRAGRCDYKRELHKSQPPAENSWAAAMIGLGALRWSCQGWRSGMQLFVRVFGDAAERLMVARCGATRRTG